MDPLIESYQERMMKDPAKYLGVLRRMNALHLIWHGELQDRIRKLEIENAYLRQANADAIDVN